MKFIFYFTPTAIKAMKFLKESHDLQKRYKAVVKALAYLQENPKHPALQTHKYYSMQGPLGEEVFEAYAEQSTSAAYRIFFYYGPGRGEITVFAVTPHP